jgi:hypothetical protein
VLFQKLLEQEEGRVTQTYPLPIPSTLKVDDGVARTNPTPSYGTAATSTPAYTPAVWNPDKATNHPPVGPSGGLSPARTDPDFVFAALVSKSSNMPY